MSEVTGVDVNEVTSLVPETTEAKQYDTGKTTGFTDAAQLKGEAPDVYEAMLEGIAQNIINDLRDHQARMKELMQEARREAGE